MKKDGKKVQILYLIYQLGYGGAQRLILDLIRNLDRSEYEPVVAMWGGRRDIAEEFKELGVDIVDFEATGKADIHALWRLFVYLKENKVDILNTHLAHSHIVGRIAGRAAGIPHIIATHQNMYTSNHPVSRFVDVCTSWMDDVGTAISKGVEESWYGSSKYFNKKSLLEKRKKHFTIHSGVDLDKIDNNITKVDKGEKRKKLGVGRGRFVFTCAARFHPVKGHRFLIKAASQLREDHPSLRVLLLGDGPLEDSLREEVRNEGLTDHVRFMGYREDVYEILAASDAFVLPSIHEGFGIAIAEAMAASLPVVASDIPAIAEVVEGGHTGLLVSPSDGKALARAMREYLQDHRKARRHGRKGRKRVEEKFSMRTVSEKYQELYDAVLSMQG